MAQVVFDRGDGYMHRPDDYHPSLHVFAEYPSQRELESNCSSHTMESKDIHVFGFPQSRYVTVSRICSALPWSAANRGAG